MTDPIKIGVVGCGAIAHIQHLPNLTSLRDQFEVTVVCDISPAAANYTAKKFYVPQALTDYRHLLETDIEAVLLCQADPKTEIAVAAFEAGKHVFIEKPMCYSWQEADSIIAAQKQAGKVGQVGYMKVYDPAFALARQEAAGMQTIRFVQINHLHPDNALHLRQFQLARFDDYPTGPLEAIQTARKAAIQEAIGLAPEHVERAFFILAGSMIHDLYGLRTIMGLPDSVVSTEIWQEGRAINVVLAYPNGARCVASWVDLPDLWDFKETLEIYGDDKRVILSYPTGFARGILSELTIQAMDDAGNAYCRQPAIDWESAFVRELRHFYDCIVNNVPCHTSVAAARDDVGLIIDIIQRYLQP